jgi:hypothetical protein
LSHCWARWQGSGIKKQIACQEQKRTGDLELFFNNRVLGRGERKEREEKRRIFPLLDKEGNKTATIPATLLRNFEWLKFMGRG